MGQDDFWRHANTERSRIEWGIYRRSSLIVGVIGENLALVVN